MTILQTLQVRQSEIRESINALLGNDSRTDEQQGELEKLTAEGLTIEPEIRAAIVASPDPEETQTVETEGTEIRQRRELSDQSDLGRIYAAVIEHRQVDGREGELQTEFGLPANHIPLSMLRGEEHRAVTPAPGSVGQPQSEIIPYVFPQSVADNTVLVILDPLAITDEHTFRWGEPPHVYKIKAVEGLLQNGETGVRFASEVTVIR